MTIKSAPTRPRRKRRGADLCDKTRSWIWLACIRRKRPGSSFDALDALVFNKDPAKRVRAFWRIARTGHSPDRCHSGRGFSLVEKIGRLEGFEHTEAVYRSKLWVVLGRRHLSCERLHALRRELLETFHLRQPGAQPAGLAGIIRAGGSDRGSATPQEFAARLTDLAPPPCVEWLALLCVYYRLAIDDVDLEVALELRAMIRNYCEKLLRALQVWRVVTLGADELQFLIEARVLRGETGFGNQDNAMERGRSAVKSFLAFIASDQDRASPELRREQSHLELRVALTSMKRRGTFTELVEHQEDR